MQVRRSSGFSLVELMVAMVAGLILIAAVTALFATILRANSTAMKVSRLNQEVQSITDMVTRDITRAGYDASAAQHTLVSGANSPFYFDASADLMDEVSPATVPRTFRCIRIRYDDSGNGVLDNSAASSFETLVYSYSNGSKGIKLATGASAACDSSNLISTDDTIEITQLTFSLLPSSQVNAARAIQLNISGRYKDNTALSVNLQRVIKLRNDGH